MARARSDEALQGVFRDVVVIPIKTATGDPIRGGESMEFFEVRIAHEMRPQAIVGGPAGVIDQDHGLSLWRVVHVMGDTPRHPFARR